MAPSRRSNQRHDITTIDPKEHHMDATTILPAATEADNNLTDVARDVAFDVLDTSNGNAEEATRILLLAAAELGHRIELFGRAVPISTALLQAMRDTLDGLDRAAS